jgi:hypothetical protein
MRSVGPLQAAFAAYDCALSKDSTDPVAERSRGDDELRGLIRYFVLARLDEGQSARPTFATAPCRSPSGARGRRKDREGVTALANAGSSIGRTSCRWVEGPCAPDPA